MGVFIIGIKIHCQSSYDTPIILSAPQQLLKKVIIFYNAMAAILEIGLIAPYLDKYNS